MTQLVKAMIRQGMKISGAKQLLWHANQLNVLRFFEYSTAVQFLEVAESGYQDTQGLQFLDVGTGPSIFPSFLASYYNISIICSDMDASVLTYQHSSFQRAGLDNFTGVCLDAQNLPFSNNSFDRVVSISVVEHIGHDTTAIVEMVRVLKPSGILVLSFPFSSYKPREARGMLDMGWYYIFRKNRKGFLQRYYHPQEFIRLIHDAGADVETYALFGGLLMKLTRIIPPGLFLYKDYVLYKLYERFGFGRVFPDSNAAEGVMVVKVRKPWALVS